MPINPTVHTQCTLPPSLIQTKLPDEQYTTTLYPSLIQTNVTSNSTTHQLPHQTPNTKKVIILTTIQPNFWSQQKKFDHSLLNFY